MTAARLALLLSLLAACKDDPPAPAPLHNQVSVPAPVLVKEITVAGTFIIHDTFIRDGIAFVCAWNAGVIIFDVGNGMSGGSPENPVEISRLITAASGIGGAYVHNAWWFHNPVTNEKKYLFIGQEGAAKIGEFSNGDIHVVDVSNLAQPVEVATYHMNGPPPAGTHNFWVDEPAQILYAAYYNGGVVAIDISDTLMGSLASREIARVKPAGNTFMWGVQLSGSTLYATDMLNGLYPLSLTLATDTSFSFGPLGIVSERYTSDLQIIGNVAYTGTWGGIPLNGVRGNALKIWTLGPAGAPTLADSLIFGGITTVSDVKSTADNKLLVASAEGGPWGGLYVYSLANPQKPVLVARETMSVGMHTAKPVDINGRKYVFATRNAGAGGTAPAVRIYDVTDLAP